MRITNNLYNFNVQKSIKRDISTSGSPVDYNPATPSFEGLGNKVMGGFRIKTPMERALVLIVNGDKSQNLFSQFRKYSRASSILKRNWNKLGIDGQETFVEANLKKARVARKNVYIEHKTNPVEIYGDIVKKLIMESSPLLKNKKITGELSEEIASLATRAQSRDEVELAEEYHMLNDLFSHHIE